MSATNRGSVRRKHDAYYTPITAIDSLLSIIDKYSPKVPESLLEPCAGPGSQLVDRVWNKFPKATMTSYDIQDGTDFLKIDTGWRPRWDLCITNPPYSHAQAFIVKILDSCESAAILLRLNFLGSQKRHDFWQSHMPDALLVLSKRPSFTLGGTDATEYAWFCWGPMFQRMPRIQVL